MYLNKARLPCKGPFTWSGGPRSSGDGFFCFHALEDTKQRKPTPLDRGPPLHVNRVFVSGFEARGGGGCTPIHYLYGYVP